VPLARDLHPEFGYVGSAPRLWRKLGLAVSFIVFGLVAAASGVAVFMAEPEPDPMHAMALAPAQALISAPSSAAAGPADTKAADAADAQKTFKAGAMKPRSVQAVNERPAIAAVSIGHGAGPAVLPSEPAIPVAATPETPEGSATPADGADPAAVTEFPAPAASAKKARTRSHHVQRDRNEYLAWPGSSYQRGGYARMW
jgi:hypothetical protein